MQFAASALNTKNTEVRSFQESAEIRSGQSVTAVEYG